MSKRTLNLYDILPVYIRQQDSNQHTRRFLAAADVLLDQLHGTLEQYLADNFADAPLDKQALAAQEWLLPYFADLLDVNLVSPLPDGKRFEVSNAVRWRQRKGSLRVVDEVAQGVGQWEVVVQEAWRRLAMTPRLDAPLLPESYYGLDTALNPHIASAMAKHPGLPAVTPDFRIGSRAVSDEDHSPNSQVSQVRGQAYRWRQQAQHGVPCHHQRMDLNGEFRTAGFDDVSLRTPDLRSANWRQGHYHPRRVLLHMVQPEGFFQTGMARVQWRQQWLDDEVLPSDPFLQQVTLYSRLDRTLVFENRALASTPLAMVEIGGVFRLAQVAVTGVGNPDAFAFHFAGLVLRNRVEIDSGRVSFDRCAVKHVEVHSHYASGDPRHLLEPVLVARHCVFRVVQTATSLTRLEYCTVLKKCVTEALQASDCIFTCLIHKDHPSLIPPPRICVRYSRILAQQQPAELQHKAHNVNAAVWFFANSFGRSGGAVLHPATDESVRYGGEDGTEMGAYHFQQLSLRFDAVKTKLKDFLPVGFEVVVIPDENLTRLPELLAP